MQDKNQEVSKQNIGDDPIDRPKVTQVKVRIKTDFDETVCVSDITVILDRPHNNYYPYLLTLKFANFSYSLPSSPQYDADKTLYYFDIMGRIFNNPNQSQVDIEVRNQSGGVIATDRASYEHSDTCEFS